MSSGLDPMIPQKSRDKLFIFLFFCAMTGGLALSLMSAGHLLAFNVNNLMIAAIVFTIGGSTYIIDAKPLQEQIAYVSLSIIPIVLRSVFNMPMFGSWEFKQIGFMAQVTALWMLVAVSEEAFRATMMNFSQLFWTIRDKEANAWYKALFSNTIWLLFHFFQRPFDPWTYRWYIIWLFISGLVMTYVMMKAGLGAAATVHLLVNISA